VVNRSVDAASDSLENTLSKGAKNAKSAFAMFSKVQGGREVSADHDKDEKLQLQSVLKSDQKPKSDDMQNSPTRDHDTGEAVSLNIQNNSLRDAKL